MTGTEDLRAEHVGVRRMLDIMDSMGGRARRGEQLEADDLAQTVEFLRVFVDKCHHTKEEELLFPAIRAANISSAEQTILVLLADHARGRDDGRQYCRSGTEIGRRRGVRKRRARRGDRPATPSSFASTYAARKTIASTSLIASCRTQCKSSSLTGTSESSARWLAEACTKPSMRCSIG